MSGLIIHLLCFMQNDWYGNLLVFEETESGELIAWEEWRHIREDRQPDVYYCGDGIFMAGGMDRISVGHYTREGERLANEFLEALGEGKEIMFPYMKIISLEELQNP